MRWIELALGAIVSVVVAGVVLLVVGFVAMNVWAAGGSFRRKP